MADISPYLDAGAVGIQVKNITGNSSDGWKAGGYSAWVSSITGQVPRVTVTGDKTASLSLTQAQAKLMRNWLDEQVKKGLMKKEKPSLELGFGTVAGPWAMRYVVPAAIIFFALGYLTRHFVK